MENKYITDPLVIIELLSKKPRPCTMTNSSFAQFIKDKKEQVSRDFPHLKGDDNTKVYSEMWQLLSEDEKYVYKSRALQNNQRYYKETQKFKESIKDVLMPTKPRNRAMDYFINEQKGVFTNLRPSEQKSMLLRQWHNFDKTQI